jgi:hypothetical protein
MKREQRKPEAPTVRGFHTHFPGGNKVNHRTNNPGLGAVAFILAVASIFLTSGAVFSQVQASDPATQEDLSTTEVKQSPPPDVQGAWCGTLNDSRVGSGTIAMTISQNRSKLGGIWTSDLSGSGTFKGKIAGNAVTFTLRQKGSACHAAVSGTLVQSGEITGSYSIFGCHQADGGTFDMTSSDC